MLFYSNFNIAQVLGYFKIKGDLAVCYELDSTESTDSRGIVEMDSNNRITKFLEKPDSSQTNSRLASVVFYCFRKESLGLIDKYVAMHKQLEYLVFGKLLVYDTAFCIRAFLTALFFAWTGVVCTANSNVWNETANSFPAHWTSCKQQLFVQI
jgi:glucuronokinase